MRRRPRSRRLAARSDRCVFSLKRSGAEWAPFLDGERGETGGTADDNGETLFSELWPKRRVQRRRTIHDPAARRHGAVCKPRFIRLTSCYLTAQHCLITESRHGPRSEAQLIVHLGGGRGSRGSKDPSGRHLAYETTQVCFPNSSGDFRRTCLGCSDWGCDHLDLF